MMSWHFSRITIGNPFIFGPDVEKSKIVEHSGNHYRVYRRFRRTKIITVVLNTDHDVNYFSDSATRAHSRSSANRALIPRLSSSVVSK